MLKQNNIWKMLFISLLISATTFGQSKRDSLFALGICDENGYCVPQLPGIGRTKGIEIDYGAIFRTPIETTIDNKKSYDTILKNRKTTVSLRFPLLMKQSFKLFMGLKYEAEEFKFGDDKVLLNEFHNAINTKSLRTFGSTIYFSKPFKGNAYLAGRVSLRLSGDFSRKELDDYFRSSATVIYGKRARNDMVWGVGVSYSYIFGRQTILPVLAYSRKFNANWSLTALLPAKVSVRYEINEKNNIQFETRLSGDKYNITLDEISQNNLYLERSDWYTTVVYEREIYDFLWFGLKAGNRYNISFDLSERSTFLVREPSEIFNKLTNTWFVQGSIFLVPPRKWSKKKNKH